MNTDPVADYLTRVRNALKAGHKVVEMPSSKLKAQISQVLEDQGYIHKYKVEDTKPQAIIKIGLKYDRISKTPVIKGLTRVSKPGLRKYTGSKELPRVKNGLGIAIMSTSHGVMTGKEAKLKNIGGEILCYVY